MRNLLYFILRYNALLTFIILQMVSWTLIIRYNNFQRAAILNSANIVSGTLSLKTTEIRNYLSLKELNDSLVNENALLFAKVKTLEEKLQTEIVGANCTPEEVPLLPTDSLTGKLLYKCTPAMVINSSINRTNNFLTIDKGAANGIKPETGVVSKNSVVGVVDQVSEHFATIVPIINKGLRISAKIKRNNFKGSLQWAELDPLRAILYEVPKHANVQVGDTIITTGYSDFFPPDIFIGTVEKWTLSEGSNFYTTYVKLGTDFNNIRFVYIIDYLSREEQLNLETKSNK
ncbi:rod shape-determining protein MreC [Sphingobacteriales bacterium UPWRP_1]|nr:rod shape-determining protein MreC [Sphingobacteriales bacterium TSM_CSM]PSJ72694.1 rod shape-determining protein MreC [Sphingobacteriales bacterium UPWRP_1]